MLILLCNKFDIVKSRRHVSTCRYEVRISLVNLCGIFCNGWIDCRDAFHVAVFFLQWVQVYTYENFNVQAYLFIFIRLYSS